MRERKCYEDAAEKGQKKNPRHLAKTYVRFYLSKDKVSAQVLHGEDDGLVDVAAVGVHVALLNTVHLLQRYHQAKQQFQFKLT